MCLLVLPTLYLKPFPNKNWRQKKKPITTQGMTFLRALTARSSPSDSCCVERTNRRQDTKSPRHRIFMDQRAASVLRTQLWSSVMTTGVNIITFPGKQPSSVPRSPLLQKWARAFHIQLRFFFPLTKAFNQNSSRWLLSMDRIRMAVDTGGRVVSAYIFIGNTYKSK